MNCKRSEIYIIKNSAIWAAKNKKNPELKTQDSNNSVELKNPDYFKKNRTAPILQAAQ
jgi:hypothetical protein